MSTHAVDRCPMAVIPAEVDSVMERAEHEFDYYDDPATREAAWRELARLAGAQADEAGRELAQLGAAPFPLFLRPVRLATHHERAHLYGGEAGA